MGRAGVGNVAWGSTGMAEKALGLLFASRVKVKKEER
jgi:hypothetical protein